MDNSWEIDAVSEPDVNAALKFFTIVNLTLQ